jgi:hypothetical protein
MATLGIKNATLGIIFAKKRPVLCVRAQNGASSKP